MSQDERYLSMACACGAVWVEDRLEPGPTCPGCTHYEAWLLVDNCPRLMVGDAGQFDITSSDLAKFLDLCQFGRPPARGQSRGRLTTERWAYGHAQGKTRWSISVEASSYKGTDVLRCVSLAYTVNRKPALEAMFLSLVPLRDTLADIIGTIRRHSDTTPLGVDALFCGASVVE